MNSKELASLYENLDILIGKKLLNNRFITVFGANVPAGLTVRYLKSNGIQVNSIIDNNPDKTGAVRFGIRISSPEEVLKSFNDNAAILIASKYYDDMRAQLSKYGYEQGKHIFKTISFSEYTLDEDVFLRKCSEAREGLLLYNDILKQYGKDTVIYINPYSGLGDACLICGYMDAHAEKYNISRYVLTAVGKSAANVSKMFGIENLLVLTQSQSDSLVLLRSVTDCRIKVLSHMYLHWEILINFENMRRLNWGEMIRDLLLGLNETTPRKQPVAENGGHVLKMLEERGVPKGRTVILAPYAIALPSLENEFWEYLAMLLKERGFSVYTNSADKTEPMVKNTLPISFNLEDAAVVLQYAGYFIGLRSGLCDLLSGSKCKKVVVYPDDASLFFFGMKNIGLATDAKEVVYEEGTSFVKELVDTILIREA